MLYVGLYTALGVIVYRSFESTECEDPPAEATNSTTECTEPWTITDSLYFSVVTMSTVGYGDFSPSTPFTQAFTLIYIFVGIIVVFSSISEVMGMILDPFLQAGRDMLERVLPQEEYDVDGNGVADFKIPREWYIYYPKNLLPSILLNIFMQQISAAVFVAIEGWDYWTAMYHCYVTASTVGYGDISIETYGGKVFAIFHIMLSVCLLGGLVADLTCIRDQRLRQLKRVNLLVKKLDADLILSLDRDKTGVDKVEFVVGMLTKLDIVSWQDVEPFLLQFEAMDKTSDGRLTTEDLENMVLQNEQRFGQLVRSTTPNAPNLPATDKVTPFDASPGK